MLVVPRALAPGSFSAIMPGHHARRRGSGSGSPPFRRVGLRSRAQGKDKSGRRSDALMGPRHATD